MFISIMNISNKIQAISKDAPDSFRSSCDSSLRKKRAFPEPMSASRYF